MKLRILILCAAVMLVGLAASANKQNQIGPLKTASGETTANCAVIAGDSKSSKTEAKFDVKLVDLDTGLTLNEALSVELGQNEVFVLEKKFITVNHQVVCLTDTVTGVTAPNGAKTNAVLAIVNNFGQQAEVLQQRK